MNAPRGPARAACALLAAAFAWSAAGCTRTPDATAAHGDGRWSSTATEVAQPARWPDAAYVESLAPSRELVRSYLRAAAVGDRATMTDAYLDETRRSAETVIARDIELASPGGAYSPGPTNTTSVFVFEGGLFPPTGDFTVEAEDEARLKELKAIHDDATLVMTRFPNGGTRTFFVVRDGEALHLVP